jgi:hypothetical protein
MLILSKASQKIKTPYKIYKKLGHPRNIYIYTVKNTQSWQILLQKLVQCNAFNEEQSSYMKRTGILKHYKSVFNSAPQQTHKVECFLMKKKI